MTADTDFVHTIYAAAQRKEPGKLVDYLLSDRPLGPGERQYLAQLIAGDLRRPRGNLTQVSAAEKQFRRWAFSEVRAEQARLRREKYRPGPGGTIYKVAMEKIAEELGIECEQLLQWCRNPKRHGAYLPRGYECDRDGVVRKTVASNR